MMMKNSFLDRAENTSSFLSEQKILDSLSELDKAVVITMENLEFFSKHYFDIKATIEILPRTEIFHLSIGVTGIEKKVVLAERAVDEFAFHNLVDDKFGCFRGFCFVVDSGINYMMINGSIDNTVSTSLHKIKTMQEMLNTKKNVRDLPEVFENFYSACKYNHYYYNECFDSCGKIKAEIKEQELRNILMRYLNSKVKGDVSTEFCTDYQNDEESVDIYVYDGLERAIIEVKFSFTGNYYLGSTYYPFETRIGDGFKQLDKYAIHLAKDKRQVEYGFLYMFYINDMIEDTIQQKIKNKHTELDCVLSIHFKTIYKKTWVNDMKYWAAG
jgi:hypothetical protein